MSEPAGGTGLLERTDLAATSDTPWQTLLRNEVRFALSPAETASTALTLADGGAPARPEEHTGGVALLENESTPNWVCLLWNDPVNLADVVVKVLRQVLTIDEDTAHRLMLVAHTAGRAAVTAGSQEHCQDIATKLSGFNLWATIEKGGQ